MWFPQDASDRLFKSLARAEDAVGRLDERVRALPYRRGFRARLDILEAHAWGWTSGQIVGLEDLLLHGEAMDVRAPSQALRAAHGLVLARRKAAQAGGELLSPQGAAWLVGARRRPPVPGAVTVPPTRASDEEGPGMVERLVTALDRLAAADTETVEAALLDGLSMLDRVGQDAPLLLQAAAALDAWRLIDPLPRASFVGPLLVAHWLKAKRRVTSHLLPLESGLRALTRKHRLIREAPSIVRLEFQLRRIAMAAEEGLSEIRRLDLARQVVVQKIAGRRAHSHLGAVLDLLLEQPLVTAATVASRLSVTPQSARRLLADLGGSVVEVSGRARFRAWRL